MKKYTIATLMLIGCVGKSPFIDGVNHYRKGDFQKAVECFDQAISDNPQNADAYYERSSAKYALHDFYGALQDVSQAIQINEHPAYLNNRSAINSKMGDFTSAVSDASRAIELKGDYTQAYLNRAGAYDMLNMSEKAINDYTEALKIDRDNLTALLNRGGVHQKLGNIESACEDWQQARELGDRTSISFIKNYCR